jgi:hypothetical protein
MTIDLTTFESATATIDCAGKTHSIRWEAGELTAVDHGEAESELALAALGGTGVPCLDVLTSWRRHRHDHRLLTALTKGPADAILHDDRGQHGRPSAAMLRRMQTGGPMPAIRSRARLLGGQARFYASNSLSGPVRMRPGPTAQTPGPASDDEEIETLARLGRRIPWRLVATVTAALLEPPTSPDQRTSSATPALTASLFGRAQRSLSSWSGNPNLDIDLEVIEPTESPHLRAKPDQRVNVALPLTWVAEVWGRGLAVIGEQFTLAIVRAESDHFVAETINTDLKTRRRVAVRTTPTC